MNVAIGSRTEDYITSGFHSQSQDYFRVLAIVITIRVAVLIVAVAIPRHRGYGRGHASVDSSGVILAYLFHPSRTLCIVSHHHRHHCGPSHVSSFLCIAVIVSHSRNGFPQSHRHSRSLPSAIGTKEKGECIERKESHPHLCGWRRQDENARTQREDMVVAAGRDTDTLRGEQGEVEVIAGRDGSWEGSYKVC
jgi:hypothetical protein